MKRKDFVDKVIFIRDSLILEVEKLAVDNDNFVSNVKNIKEMTMVLKELDKIISDDDETGKLEKQLAQDDFFDSLRKNVEIPYKK